jgi:tetratricopeptide (TPR) repeat protein
MGLVSRRRLGAGGLLLAAAWLAVASLSARQAGVAPALDRYQPGVSAVQPLPRDVLWSGAGDFRRDAIAWIAAGPLADQPRRRLSAATYALDLLKDFEETLLWEETQAASTLLEWACARLRESAPLPAERAWHIAALAVLERSSTVTVLRRHLEHAESRFPDDDKWTLVRALTDEWESRERPRDDGTMAISSGLAARAMQHFQQAASRPSVRQEALLRWGAYESDLGRHDAALAHFNAIGELSDPFLRYWLGLVKGRALRRANRAEEAIAAYQVAVAEFPSAQSATLGLAAALVSARRMADAAAIVNGVVSPQITTPSPDPWNIFRSPDVRFWPRALDELRRAVAP